MDIEIPVGVLGDSPMPLLIGRQVLKDMKIRTDFENNVLSTPGLRDRQQHLVARESCTGHILLPMTKKTWLADLHDDEGVVHANMSEAKESPGTEGPPSSMNGPNMKTEPKCCSPE